MRKIAIIFGALGAIFILGLAIIWGLADPNRHRERIQAELEKQLNRKVTLGHMSLGLLPLRFQVRTPVIAEDPRFGQQPFVQAENLAVRVRLLPLLRGQVEVDSIDLTRPKVELIRARNGEWNFSTLGQQPASAGQPAPTADASSRQFTLNRVTVTDAQVATTDLRNKAGRAVYDHIDLTVLDLAPGKPFTFDLAAHLQGKGAQELRLKGQGGPVAANPSETPFQGTLTLKEAGIENVLSGATGTISGQSDIASQAGRLTASGKFNLEAARLNQVDIGYPIQIGYKAGLQIADGRATIEKATIQLRQTPLTLTGTLNTAATPVTMDLRIKSGDASIAEVARLASAFGVAFAPGTNVTGSVNADLRATGSTSRPVLTGTVAGQNLNISGNGIAQPVQVKTVTLTLTPTAIQSNEFTATSGKAAVAGRFSLLQYASNSPVAEVALRTPGATLPEIQSIAKAYGMTSLDQLSGSGALNFDLTSKGRVSSLTTDAVLRSLNGIINIDFSPLKILGFDTLHDMGSLAGIESGPTEQRATDFLKIAGRIIVRDGVAQTDNLKAQVLAGSLTTSGTADLPSQALNMRAIAVFSKAASDKIRSARGGSFMNAAFSNSDGEIVLPAIVTGTFAKPRFSADLVAVAQLQKQRAVSTVLGVLTGTKDEEDTTEKKRGVLGGIFDKLRGKK